MFSFLPHTKRTKTRTFMDKKTNIGTKRFEEKPWSRVFVLTQYQKKKQKQKTPRTRTFFNLDDKWRPVDGFSVESKKMLQLLLRGDFSISIV